MPISLLQPLFVIALISTVISLTNLGHAYKQCQDDQKTLLLELKNDLKFNSSISKKLVRWNQTDDCCKWKGVGCDAVGHVVSLQLDYEGISGGIENSSSLVSLEYLHKLNLAHNSLNRSISTLNWSRFSQLKKLSLASCNLHKFPDFLKQSNLNCLDLSDNQITAEIPSWIWEIGNGGLYHLNLSYNVFVELQKPYHIPNFLSELDLHSNQLRGELPLLPPGVSYVDFSYNKFEKTIPLSFVSSNSLLIFLSIENNNISGSIPTCICSAESIQILQFSHNNLNGSIPPCLVERMSSLQMLYLWGNNLSGEIPDKFSTSCGLRTLHLYKNNLGGIFPKSLGNCKSLEFLQVGKNYIEGSFPCMLPSRLKILVLNSNKFVGEVKCGRNWQNLQIIDISSNRFNGEVKWGRYWPNLQIIDISRNKFNGDLKQVSFSNWKKMVLNRDLKSMKHHRLVPPNFNYLNIIDSSESMDIRVVDFSCNNFDGEIPEAIGDLSMLHLLNLSHNALTGRIPKSLGNMTSLEALDLSVNQLTETIPMELTRLTFLGKLNLSYNNLVGKIPSRNQFSTFENSSFEGNKGLCGMLLSRSCSNDGGDDSPKIENMQPHGKSEMEWYCILLIFLATIYLYA